MQTYFTGRLGQLLAAHGKGMVGWDEILRPDLRGDAVIQSWRGPESLRRAVGGGHPAILSAGFYLDHLRPAEFHYAVDPLAAAGVLDSTWAPRVLGGEACMWGEQINPETIDSRIWPRLAAVAERLWSPVAMTEVDDMYRRLELTSHRLAELGLGHERHTERMLRRYGPAGDVPALTALLELVTPAYSWERARIQRLTRRTALTGLVDAARPDRWRARRSLAALVAGLLADAPQYQQGRDSLLALFTQWGRVAEAVLQLDRHHRLAREALPAAAALGALAEVGRGALVLLPGTGAPDSATRAGAWAVLDRVGRPQGLVRLELAEALAPLVRAAYSP